MVTFTVNLDTLKLSINYGITLKRRDSFPVLVNFTRGGKVVSLDNGASGVLTVKKEGANASSPFLALSSSWSPTGSDASPGYLFNVAFNTENLVAALAVSNPVAAVVEIAWENGTNRWASSNAPVPIYDNLFGGNAPDPTPGPAIILDGGASPAPVYLFQVRRDLADNWTSNNPILSSGELGFEEDTGKLKVGDGSTEWSSLPYFSGVFPGLHMQVADGHLQAKIGDGSWTNLIAVSELGGGGGTGGIGEAPSDDNYYMRHNGSWATLAPRSSGTLSIQGDLFVGAQISVTGVSWSNNPTLSYQWYSSQDGTTWEPIGGATDTVYTNQPSDAGLFLKIVVQASNQFGTTSREAVTGNPVVGYPVNSAIPSIGGVFSEAQVLTVQPGTWLGSPTLSYQWYSSSDGTTWEPISGATNTVYTIQPSDLGLKIHVVETATNSLGSATATSGAVSKVSLYDGLQAYWPLDDDGSGNLSLVDVTGNGFDLINNNGVAVGSGIVGGAAFFSGGIALSQTNITNYYEVFSVSAWIKTPIPNEYLGQWRLGGAWMFAALQDGTASLALYTSNGIQNITSASKVTDDSWHHWVGVVDKTNQIVSLYIDGIRKTSSFIYDYLFEDRLLNIGGVDQEFGIDWTNGSVDEVGIWNRALSDFEVAALYNAGTGLPFTEFQTT